MDTRRHETVIRRRCQQQNISARH